MTDAEGARRSARIREVLDPSFIEGVTDLPVEEIRRRRDLALVEREFLSYLRRLLQGHREILAAERGRRLAGGEDVPVVERVASALASGSGPRPVPRGEAVRTAIDPADLAEAERHAQSVLGAAAVSDLEGLGDDELARLLDVLDAEERRVSADRSAVFVVHDRLQEELKRRYRDDPTSIPVER